MNIETKFEVGDTIYTIDPDTLKMRQYEVGAVSAITSGKGTAVYISPKGETYKSIDEGKCFRTRSELLTHITQP